MCHINIHLCEKKKMPRQLLQWFSHWPLLHVNSFSSLIFVLSFVRESSPPNPRAHLISSITSKQLPFPGLCAATARLLYLSFKVKHKESWQASSPTPSSASGRLGFPLYTWNSYPLVTRRNAVFSALIKAVLSGSLRPNPSLELLLP